MIHATPLWSHPMTPDQLRPAVGQYYRNRRTGQLMLLRRYYLSPPWPRDANHNYVRLVADDGRDWIGSAEDFWETWQHASIHNPEEN